jgi:hypothetical protein
LWVFPRNIDSREEPYSQHRFKTLFGSILLLRFGMTQRTFSTASVESGKALKVAVRFFLQSDMGREQMWRQLSARSSLQRKGERRKSGKLEMRNAGANWTMFATARPASSLRFIESNHSTVYRMRSGFLRLESGSSLCSCVDHPAMRGAWIKIQFSAAREQGWVLSQS